MSEREFKIVVRKLRLEEFYIKINRDIFQIMLRQSLNSSRTDDVSIITCLVESGMTEDSARDHVLRISELGFKDRDINTLIVNLKNLYTRRKQLWAACQLAKGNASDEVRSAIDGDRSNTVTADVDEVFQEMQEEIEGTRFNVEFPGWPVMTRIQALIPGSIMLLCGSPGVSKSFFVLEALWQMFFDEISVGILEGEKGAKFHLRRAFAQLSGQSWLTVLKEVKKSPDRVRELQSEYRHQLEAMKKVIYSPEYGQSFTCDLMLSWIRERCEEGTRVLCIDPVSIMQGQEKRFLDHERFIENASMIMIKYKASLICVTHPSDGNGVEPIPSIENIPGSKVWRRCVDTIGWLEWHHPDTCVFYDEDNRGWDKTFNRTFYDLKTRLAEHTGRIGFWFNRETLRHEERGQLVEDKGDE